MAIDASKSPDHVLALPVKPRPPSGDCVAADLRGFGRLGILAILVIHAGNLVIVPLSAVLALVWARWSRTPRA